MASPVWQVGGYGFRLWQVGGVWPPLYGSWEKVWLSMEISVYGRRESDGFPIMVVSPTRSPHGSHHGSLLTRTRL